ncbi:MAG: hypothetical protein HYW49_12945 [Deltaproteobacteria bacterium]|nr:hypothetical protein [Deltaproteobacteria bacterium]
MGRNTYDLDPFNTEVAAAVDCLAELKIPIYTNYNVRSEFLELHRRIIIPECLADFLEDLGSELNPELVNKLTSMRTQMRKTTEDGRVYKLQDQQIKYFRSALAVYQKGDQDGWETFCQNYLHEKIERVWDTAVELLGLNFIDLRGDNDSAVLSGKPSWKGTTDLVGKFGIGTVDALILDLFFNSKFLFLLSSDRDMGYCVAAAKQPDRFVFLPDSLMNLW